MEFLLFLFFLFFSVTLTGVISYYVNLLFFHRKEVYEREEITQVLSPLLNILMNVCESGGNLILGAGLFISFALLAWFWSLLGGAVGTPHYTHSFGNYFFNAPLLYLAFLFGYPFLKDGFSSPGPSKQFFDQGRAVVSGLGLGTWSANLAAWGLYHDFYFLFVFVSGTVVVYPLCYLWNGKAFFGITIGPRPKVTPLYEDEDMYQEETEQEPRFDSSSHLKRSRSNEDSMAQPEAGEFPDGEDVSWDEDPFEGGLGDDAPSLDDFEEPK